MILTKMRRERGMGCLNFCPQGLGGEITQIKNGNIYQANQYRMPSEENEETIWTLGTKQFITGIFCTQLFSFFVLHQ